MNDLPYPVSRETKQKLERYQALLHKWQNKINLVSNATLAQSWERHFQDSIQLALYLPAAQDGGFDLFDLGSGAGFPGLVLAILRPDIRVHLVESDQKKCSFMRTVARETDIPVEIYNERIETVSRETRYGNTVPDIVTARALASLEELLTYCAPWIAKNPDIALIFPKGAKAEEEIAAARQKWDFEYCTHQSATEENAKICLISSVYDK